MLTIDAAIDLIVSYAKSKGWGAEQYARAAGVPPSTARDLLRGRGNPTADQCTAVPITDLYQQAQQAGAMPGQGGGMSGWDGLDARRRGAQRDEDAAETRRVNKHVRPRVRHA